MNSARRLTSSSAGTELLIRRVLPANWNERQRITPPAFDAAQRLLLMVGDVIDVAAIEAGYIRLDIAGVRAEAGPGIGAAALPSGAPAVATSP